MMAYLWSCCLICKRFKKIKEADAQVTESLNVEKLFLALEQPEINRMAIEKNRGIIEENRKMIMGINEAFKKKMGMGLTEEKEENFATID